VTESLTQCDSCFVPYEMLCLGSLKAIMIDILKITVDVHEQPYISLSNTKALAPRHSYKDAHAKTNQTGLMKCPFLKF